MKKVLLSLLFVTSSTVAFAQIEKRDDPQEIDQDKIQQEPQRPSQLEMERSIRIDGQRQQNEKRARKIAKRKSKTTIVEDTLKKNLGRGNLHFFYA